MPQGLRREIGVLWSRTNDTGAEYYTGKLRITDIRDLKEIKIIVFRNNKKTNEGAPDFQILMHKEQYEALKQKTEANELTSSVKPQKKKSKINPIEEDSQVGVEQETLI
jgi:uncharacterized protein (DUF736 family)